MSESRNYWATVYRILCEIMETLDDVQDDDGEFDISVSRKQLHDLRITALLMKSELTAQTEPGKMERFKSLWRAEVSASNAMVRYLAVDAMMQATRMMESPFSPPGDEDGIPF